MMKYYGTTVNSFFIPVEVKNKYGFNGTHSQYRLVIKAKSRAAANRRWKEVTGHSFDAFLPDYTSETGNTVETSLCDTHGEIISTKMGSRDYFDLKFIVSEIKKHKEQ